MTVFSARFTILACLCAALPLAPRADAAHIRGGHSAGKDASSLSSSQRTHDQHHRTPPLLRRFRFNGHEEVHNEGENPHDHVGGKAPRSAFAQSRYRRGPGTLRRRSSVYVFGEHGDTYLVSGTAPRGRKDGTDKPPSTHKRRQVDESSLALGRIDVLVAAKSPGSTQRLASLTVDSTPVDWTVDQTSAKAFPLNASTTNQTQFIMMPMDDSSSGESSNKRVAIATEVFDAGTADMVLYCATYDPDPGQPSALLMTPCSGTTPTESSTDDATDDAADPCADGDTSSNSHQSQIFSYDPFSGKLEPISRTEDPSGVDSNTDNSALCTGAKVRRDASNATISSSVKPSATPARAATAANPSQQARNVTLVYVVGALEVPAASPSGSSNTSITTPAGSAAIKAAVFTTTITTTVVTTMPASGTPTPMPAKAAAVSVSAPVTSSTLSSSTTMHASLSHSNSTSTAPTSIAPAPADESLEVEIVGVPTPSTSTSSSSTPAASASPAVVTTKGTIVSQSSVDPTLDPVVVASMIAGQATRQ